VVEVESDGQCVTTARAHYDGDAPRQVCNAAHFENVRSGGDVSEETEGRGGEASRKVCGLEASGGTSELEESAKEWRVMNGVHELHDETAARGTEDERAVHGRDSTLRTRLRQSRMW